MNAVGNGNDSVADEVAREETRPPEPLTPGELLRREREKRSMTQLHIAEELHLDVRLVDAIEGNRFEELGVPVFARGHLRQYATLVGLSPQFIIERYEAVVGQENVPTPIPAAVAERAAIMQRRSLAGPLWMGVALIAAMLGWWMWSTVAVPGDPLQQVVSEGPAEPVQSGSTAVPLPLPIEGEGTSPQMAEGASIASEPAASTAVTSTEVTSAPVAGTPATNAAVASASTPSAPAASAASESTAASQGESLKVRLEFSDASWTEIYDATGKRLMFGLGESGRARTVSGTPPLRVTLGKASAVSVQVNDRPVVVPRQAGRDSTRFLIAADGVVQMMSGEVSVE
jgi:cytoskeleton protein RodZ